MVSEVSQPVYTLKSLILGSKYLISLTSVNEGFESAAITMEYAHFLPPSEIPSFGEDLSQRTDNSFVLTWDPPALSGSSTENHYSVFLLFGGVDYLAPLSVNQTETFLKFSNAQVSFHYTFAVVAHNAFAKSEYKECEVLFLTAPSVPTNVEVQDGLSFLDNTVTISYQTKSLGGSDSVYYTVFLGEGDREYQIDCGR